MKIKVSEPTKEERTNLFNFLLKEYKDDISKYESDEVDEIDYILDIIKQSISIQKFEIELDGVIKIIFNRISFFEDKCPESEFVLENGVAVLKLTGKLSKSVFHISSFYEFDDNKFIDITEDDIIPFGYC
jgi:hypothetical protein